MLDQNLLQGFQQKMKAAQDLELEIAQEYSIVNGQFFVSIIIKKNDTDIQSFSMPEDKKELLKKVNDHIAFLEKSIASLKEEIVKINAVREIERL